MIVWLVRKRKIDKLIIIIDKLINIFRWKMFVKYLIFFFKTTKYS